MTIDDMDREYMAELYLVAYLDMMGEARGSDPRDADTAIRMAEHALLHDAPLWRHINGWTYQERSA